MKRVAIISEYDPFHNGHKYQTDKVREMGAEGVVSILGGTFSQRGNCHITDKYFRAKAAVLSGGCDLVLELPYPYSCSGAEYFAAAGVHIASKFCDSLAFGCECDDPQILKEIALFTVSDEYIQMLNKLRNDSPEISSPRLTEIIIKNHLSDKHAEQSVLPNNILAIEYLRAIYKGGYNLEPIFIKRYGADHDSKVSQNGICSASLLRDKIINDEDWLEFCPNETAEVLREAKSLGKLGPTLKNAEKAVIYALRNINSEIADEFAECGGGLGRRIVNTASGAEGIDDIYAKLATKRYTNARIRRAVLSMLIGAKESDLRQLPDFTSLLSANKLGLSIIKNSEFSVISTPSDIRMLKNERAVELYVNAERFASLCYDKCFAEYEMFAKKPFIVT